MFNKIRFFILSLIFIVPALTYAQTGKIVGKVTDLETGEALIGANVLIEATSLGAATDENGDFIILNVSPGSYNIKARFIGYKEQLVQSVNVSVNLTTEVDFALPPEDYQTETIVVISERPLVDKNITNSTSVVKGEDIENLPVRGVNSVVSTQAGVVSGRGGLNIRGSRNDAVAYYIDGVLVNNPVFGGAQSGAITNAIEEIQVQAGGYSAEYGGANGGIISTQTRSGSEQYKLTFEGITDNFSDVGKEFMGGYTYGYSELVLTAGGPVIPSYKKLRFFVAGSNVFTRSNAAFYEGYDFKNIYEPGVSTDTFDVYYPKGYVVNNPNNTYQIQGNITWDLNPFTIRLNGNFRRHDGRSGVGVNDLAAESSAQLNEDHTMSGSLKLTHLLSNNSFYDLIVNYFGDFYVSMDPDFRHNIVAYGDSIANAAIGRQLRGDGQSMTRIRGYGFALRPNDSPLSGYLKQKTQSFGGKLNFLYQLGKHHELKTGGEFTYYTIRRYSLGNAFGIATLQKSIADGNIYDVYNRLDNYGYDVYGNETDESLEAPKNPVFAAYYIQDKMEFSDLVLNVGFRLDYIDIDGEVFKNPGNILFTNEGEIDPKGLEEVEPLLQITPRLGFSFPVTDRTVFHAQYGKFIQQTRLRDVYQGYNVVADNIKGGFAISQPVGFGLRPERTTSYEIGFRQQLGENFAFDITGFYKDIKDQVQIRSIFADEGANHKQYYAWVNGDFSTIKGIEIKIDLRRTERVALQLDYTYSDAQGTGSNPSTGFRQIWQSPTATPFFPQQIAPLDFNQTHRGFLNVDYRFGNDDGPSVGGSKILSNLGANLLFSFNSGFNYTRWNGFGNARIPQEPLNSSSTPWTFQLDARIDKSFDIGPLGFNVYLWVINVMNTKNVTNVFPNTGDPYDDGYLSSTDGRAAVEGYRQNYGEDVAQLYQDIYRAQIYTAGNFGTPRQIRLGVRLSY
ncbi:MAG: TonB-dependent receptor [Melioribacteraceae bacterium]|nr:TonB-dependent receptor [Melioribacteraceae bacterium]MCF8393849.1 TonB-dependent receptor [Melioribacteraceae bacterium]MCF8418222.1 TonB-dependent receptor [Melioribacteraceae bacterium]